MLVTKCFLHRIAPTLCNNGRIDSDVSSPAGLRTNSNGSVLMRAYFRGVWVSLRMVLFVVYLFSKQSQLRHTTRCPRSSQVEESAVVISVRIHHGCSGLERTRFSADVAVCDACRLVLASLNCAFVAPTYLNCKSPSSPSSSCCLSSTSSFFYAPK